MVDVGKGAYENNSVETAITKIINELKCETQASFVFSFCKPSNIYKAVDHFLFPNTR